MRTAISQSVDRLRFQDMGLVGAHAAPAGARSAGRGYAASSTSPFRSRIWRSPGASTAMLGGTLMMTIDDDALTKFGRPPAPDGGEGSHHLSVYLGGTTRVDLFLQQQGQTAPTLGHPHYAFGVPARDLSKWQRRLAAEGAAMDGPLAARPTGPRLDLFRRSVRQSPRDHLLSASPAPSSSARRCTVDRPRRMSAVKDGTPGELLLALVDRVSHRGGDTLALMNEAGTTLPQILLFPARLRQAGGGTASELAGTLNMSLPAVSQMVDRLFRLGLLSRAEDAEDRRRKRLATTAKADLLLDRLTRARAAEYSRGVARLSPALRKELAAVLQKAVRELA